MIKLFLPAVGPSPQLRARFGAGYFGSYSNSRIGFRWGSPEVLLRDDLGFRIVLIRRKP